MSEPLTVKEQINELKSLGEHYTARVQKRLGSGLLTQGQYVAGEIRKKIRDKHAGGRSVMANSFNPTLVKSGGEITGVEVMSTLPYARIQNEGGVIRPKRAKALAIPLSAMAKRRGPREWKDLVYITSKKGNGILAIVKKGRGKNAKDKITPHYVLRKSSKIKGSGYLEAAADVAAPVVAKALANYIELAVIDAKGGE